MNDQVTPMGDIGEAPRDSYLLAEYLRANQSKYGSFAENLARVFLEDYQADDSSRYFNQYPPPANTWEKDYATNSLVSCICWSSTTAIATAVHVDGRFSQPETL
jgi:hypothetical protein